MRPLVGSLALAVFAVGTPAGQAPPSASDLARRLQAHYDTVKDFKAEFTNSRTGGVLRSQTNVERGQVLVKKPGRMRWTDAAPDKNEIVADGTKIYTYVAADKQVYVSSLPRDNEASTGLLFLAGRGDLVRDFTATLPTVQPAGPWQLQLTPKTPREFTSLTLIVDRTSLALLGFETIDTDGSSTIRFSHLQENVGLKDSQFAFKMPKGVEVINK